MHKCFISFTKQELNTPVLLRTSSGITILFGITTLKISFSSSSKITFYLDADSCASACLIVNMLNLSDTIWTYSVYFPDCPRSRSTGAKDTKNADVGSLSVGSACGRGICAKRVCIRGTYLKSTSVKVVCVGSAYPESTCAGTVKCWKIEEAGIEGASTESAGTESAGTEGASTRGAFVGGACVESTSTESACIKSICVKTLAKGKNLMSWDSCFCGLAHIPNKSFIWCLRLLEKLISKMLISFYLHLQVILDKILYYYSTY